MSSDPDTVEEPGGADPTVEPTVDSSSPAVTENASVSNTSESPAPESPVAETAVASSAEPSGEPSAPKKMFAIGSQRDAADPALKPSQPKAVQAALANPLDLTGEEKPEPEPLPEIISLDGFSDDVDAEIEAALGGLSMDEIVNSAQAAEQELEPNARIKGTVTRIHNDNVFFKLNGQFEGVATLHHFKTPPTEGDLAEVIVRGLNKEDGLYELAVPGASIGVADWDDLSEGAVVNAMVTGSNTGGLEVAINSLRGFIPASQIDRFHVADFSQYVGQKLTCVVMEVNADKNKLVLSRRGVLERENAEKRKELLKELEAGQLRDGLVTKLMDFGAFVDLGGIEGLIHISKLSWSRVKHPEEVLKVGEKVKVKIESIDLEANRISLSHRDTLEHPWKKVDEQFAINDIVKGTVTRLAAFGAFVKIAPGIEGLVHISELAYQRVSKVSTVVNEGQEIEVKVLSVDPDSQKISLSLKACLAPPTPKASDKKEEEPEAPPRELAVPSTNEPLKGGRDRKSGGEGIGLNW